MMRWISLGILWSLLASGAYGQTSPGRCFDGDPSNDFGLILYEDYTVVYNHCESLPQPPVIAPLGAQFNRVGELASLQVLIDDPDSTQFTFGASGLPPGLSIHPQTGLISGQVPSNSEGDYGVTVAVDDGEHLVQESFLWLIRGPFGNGLQALENVSLTWTDEPLGQFRLHWSYPQGDYHTESGRPFQFRIGSALATEEQRQTHPIAPVLPGAWQAQWSSAIIDDDLYRGQSYYLEACYEADPEGGPIMCGPRYLISVPEPVTGTFATPAVTSNDLGAGRFTLSWSMSQTEGVDYYQINEVGMRGELTYYTEEQATQLTRATAGNYQFTVQACDRDRINGDSCGAASTPVSVAVPSTAQMGPVRDLRWWETGDRTNPIRFRWRYTPLAPGVLHSPDIFKITKLTGAVRHREVLAHNGPFHWYFSGHGSLYEIRACKHTGECGPVVRLDTNDPRQQLSAIPTPIELPIGEIPGSDPTTQAGNAVGGPDELRPGEWYDPARSGTGFSFYWANNLRRETVRRDDDGNLTEDPNPNYGNSYDLLAYWLTYNKHDDPDNPDEVIWRPVWVFSQLIAKNNCVIDQAVAGDCFEGALLFVTNPQRPDAVKDNIGNMQVYFGAASTHARVYISVDNKRGLNGPYDYPVEYFGLNASGSHPLGSNEHDHHSGLWWDQDVKDVNYATLGWLEADYESMTVLMYDNAGNPVWARGDRKYGSPTAGPKPERTTLDFFAIALGFDPLDTTPEWFFVDGAIAPQIYKHVGRGERRYDLEDLRTKDVWLDLNLAPANRVASLQVGTPTQLQRLEKQANWHDIRVFINNAPPERVNTCNLHSQEMCDLELTWFTDGFYPDQTAYRCPEGDHNPNHCVRIDAPPGHPTWPSAVRVPYRLGGDMGRYEFVVRRTSAADAPVIARSEVITVTDDTLLVSYPASPPDVVTLGGFTPPAPPGEPEPEPTPPPPPSSNVGATPAGFAVNSQGAATYQIPIFTLAGSGGLSPNITLSYSSAQGDGPLGMGWTIGGPSMISRCSQDFIHDGQAKALNMDSDDRLCFNGQRLFQVNDEANDYWDENAEYRTEVDSLIKITWASGRAYLIAQFPDGSRATFGRETQVDITSRIYGFPGTPLIVGSPELLLNWAQDTHQDPAGNFITYEYTHIGRPTDLNLGGGWTEFHLGKVRYTGHDGNGDFDTNDAAEHAPYAEIVFHYETSDRVDVSSRWLAGGSELRQTRRLESIESTHNGTTLRHYQLSYDTDGVGRSIVTQIQECRDDPSGHADPTQATCFDATTFGWGKNQSLVQGTSSTDLTAIQLDPDDADPLIEFFRATDINGDGYQDLIYAKPNFGAIVRVALGQPDGSLAVQDNPATFSQNIVINDQIELADVTGDGLQDILFVNETTSPTSLSVWAWNGTGFDQLDQVGTAPTNVRHINQMITGDLNGDGFGDLLMESVERDLDAHSAQNRLFIALHVGAPNTSPAYSSPTIVTLPADPDPGPDWVLLAKRLGQAAQRVQIGDVNGDGLNDLLVKIELLFCREINQFTGQCRAAPPGAPPDFQNEIYHGSWWLLENTGGGFGAAQLMAYDEACEFGCEDANRLTVENAQLVDLNSDGLADRLYQRSIEPPPGQGSGPWRELFYQLNTGAGFVDPPISIGPALVDGRGMQFIDLDGNGFVDLLYPRGNGWRIFYWRHDGFTAETNLSLHSGNSNDNSLFFDINGDGRLDYLLAARNPDSAGIRASFTLGVNNASPNPGPLNLVTTIGDGLGGVTAIDYAPLSDTGIYEPGKDTAEMDICDHTPAERQAHCIAAAVYDLITPLYVVQQTIQAGAPDLVNQYRYGALRIQAGGRGMLGFGQLWRYQPEGANGLVQALTYHQDTPFIGQLSSSQTAILNIGHWPSHIDDGNPVQREDLRWNTVPAGAGENEVRRPYVQRSEQTLYDTDNFIQNGLKRLRYSTTEVTAVDTYAYPLSVTTSHFKPGATQEQDQRLLTQSTSYSYYGEDTTTPTNPVDRIAAWQLGLIENLSLTSVREDLSTTEPTSCSLDDYTNPDQSLCIGRSTHFQYDPRGLLEQETLEPGHDQQELTTAYSLDRFGNRIESTVIGDGVDRGGSVQYDALGRWVNSQENAYGQREIQVSARDIYGNPTAIKDIYGQATHLAYDIMGRPYFRLSPDGSWSHTSLRLGDDPAQEALVSDGTLGRNRSSGNPDACPSGTTYHSFSQGGGIPESWQCLDGLGRNLRIVNTAFDGRLTYTDFTYDERGRLAKTSEPYYQNPRPTEPGPQSHAQSTTLYDTRSRVTIQVSPTQDTTVMGYAGLETLFEVLYEDEGTTRTTNRREIRNALGELVTLIEDWGGDNATTTYGYDALGQLTQVTNPDGITRTMRYNVRGMRLSLHDPDLGHATLAMPEQPSRGTSYEFSHNALGEVNRQWHPGARETIHFTYDDLGRLVEREDFNGVSQTDGSGGSTVDIAQWRYDNQPRDTESGLQGHGLLEFEQSGPTLFAPGLKRAFTYDNLGRLQDLSTTIDPDGPGPLVPEEFDEALSYDQYGRIFQTTDASQAVFDAAGLRVVYNPFGYHTWLTEAARPGDQERIYAAVLLANARVQATLTAYGNQTHSFSSYDAVGRLTERHTPGIQDWTFGYDHRGNLQSRHDAQVGLTEGFDYDGLNRLDEVQVNNAATSTYRYSKGGKLLCQGTETQCNSGHNYSYDAQQPNALSGFVSHLNEGVFTYRYDAKGNQIEKKAGTNLLRTAQYTVFNKPEHLTNPDGSTTRFRYGPNRQRYLREDSQGNQVTRTFYVGNVEIVGDYLGNVLQDGFLYRRNLGVATHVILPNGNQRTRYLHRDHLGSVDAISDDDGFLSEKLSFDAFGRRRAPDNWSINAPANFTGLLQDTKTATTRGYTGHEHIEAAGLVHMNGRTYDPQTGRFMQADPFIPNPELGQSYNRYSYVNNNPLSFTDPSGFMPMGGFDDDPIFIDPFGPPAEDPFANLFPLGTHWSIQGVGVQVRSLPQILGSPDVAVIPQAGQSLLRRLQAAVTEFTVQVHYNVTTLHSALQQGIAAVDSIQPPSPSALRLAATCKTAACRSDLYFRANRTLSGRGLCGDCIWFGLADDAAAAIHAGFFSPLGIFGGVEYHARQVVVAVNARLAPYNIQNALTLIEGESIPGLEGLEGIFLDFALIGFEQELVQRLLEAELDKRRVARTRSRMVNSINFGFLRTRSSLGSFGGIFIPAISHLRSGINQAFDGRYFNFINRTDRIILAIALRENLQKRLEK